MTMLNLDLRHLQEQKLEDSIQAALILAASVMMTLNHLLTVPPIHMIYTKWSYWAK